MSIFRAFILTHFNYCALVWHFCGATNTEKLERIQCRALRFVFLDFNSDYTTLLDRAGLPTLELAWKREILVEVYKAVMHLSPPFMWGLFTQKLLTSYNLRNSNKLYIPHLNTTKFGLRSFSAYGATLWNSLPGHIKSCGDLNSFKTCMKTWQDIPRKCNMCKFLSSMLYIVCLIKFLAIFIYFSLTNVLLFIIFLLMCVCVYGLCVNSRPTSPRLMFSILYFPD